jgi:hypothetical protein
MQGPRVGGGFGRRPRRAGGRAARRAPSSAGAARRCDRVARARRLGCAAQRGARVRWVFAGRGAPRLVARGAPASPLCVCVWQRRRPRALRTDAAPPAPPPSCPSRPPQPPARPRCALTRTPARRPVGGGERADAAGRSTLRAQHSAEGGASGWRPCALARAPLLPAAPRPTPCRPSFASLSPQTCAAPACWPRTPASRRTMANSPAAPVGGTPGGWGWGAGRRGRSAARRAPRSLSRASPARRRRRAPAPAQPPALLPHPPTPPSPPTPAPTPRPDPKIAINVPVSTIDDEYTRATVQLADNLEAYFTMVGVKGVGGGGWGVCVGGGRVWGLLGAPAPRSATGSGVAWRYGAREKQQPRPAPPLLGAEPRFRLTLTPPPSTLAPPGRVRQGARAADQGRQVGGAGVGHQVRTRRLCAQAERGECGAGGRAGASPRCAAARRRQWRRQSARGGREAAAGGPPPHLTSHPLPPPTPSAASTLRSMRCWATWRPTGEGAGQKGRLPRAHGGAGPRRTRRPDRRAALLTASPSPTALYSLAPFPGRKAEVVRASIEEARGLLNEGK